jgi:hypothetical protein
MMPTLCTNRWVATYQDLSGLLLLFISILFKSCFFIHYSLKFSQCPGCEHIFPLD